MLAEIAAIAEERSVDLVVVAGDQFDRATPTPESEQIVYRALLDLAELAPVVMVAGNHDNPRRLLAVAPLLELGRVRVGTTIALPEEGGVIEDLELPVRIVLLPWQSQRGIVLAQDLMSKDAFEHAQDFAHRLRRVIEALCEGTTSDVVNLVVGHVMVHEGEKSGSERAIHTVFEYSLPASAFPSDLSYVALGHLHRQQRLPAAAQTWYSGSPLQLDFGESEDTKGVLVVEVEPGLPARVTEVPTTSGKRMVRLRGTLEQVAAEAAGVGDSYIRVELEEPRRIGLADEVRELVPGAIDITLVSPVDTDRTGAPTRLGRNPRELFAEYLEVRNLRDDRLPALFDELYEAALET